ncbi:hypothetical protein Tco_0419285 [Tanacetum coccineum]
MYWQELLSVQDNQTELKTDLLSSVWHSESYCGAAIPHGDLAQVLSITTTIQAYMRKVIDLEKRRDAYRCTGADYSTLGELWRTTRHSGHTFRDTDAEKISTTEGFSRWLASIKRCFHSTGDGRIGVSTYMERGHTLYRENVSADVTGINYRLNCMTCLHMGAEWIMIVRYEARIRVSMWSWSIDQRAYLQHIYIDTSRGVMRGGCREWVYGYVGDTGVTGVGGGIGMKLVNMMLWLCRVGLKKRAKLWMYKRVQAWGGFYNSEIIHGLDYGGDTMRCLEVVVFESGKRLVEVWGIGAVSILETAGTHIGEECGVVNGVTYDMGIRTHKIWYTPRVVNRIYSDRGTGKFINSVHGSVNVGEVEIMVVSVTILIVQSVGVDVRQGVDLYRHRWDLLCGWGMCSVFVFNGRCVVSVDGVMYDESEGLWLDEVMDAGLDTHNTHTLLLNMRWGDVREMFIYGAHMFWVQGDTRRG